MLRAIPQYKTSSLFTPREKAAFRFAEEMAGNHKKITDDLFAELHRYFDDREILELGWRIAIFAGYGRLVYALGLDDVGKLCPLAPFHEEQAATD